MGAQWKQAGRVDSAEKKGKLFSKLAKEIAVSAKLGDPNPANNARLRAAVEAAKKQSCPRDTIERAIKKGAGLLDETMNFEMITYEGFAPHKVPVIVEALTENKNRTASEIRVLFRKGQLGSIGSVGWMFDRMGVIEATHTDKAKDPETAAIEASAQNVEPLEDSEVPAGSIGARFFTDSKDLDVVNKSLTKDGWVITLSELTYIPKNYLELDESSKKEVTEFLSALDDFDDVHRIYTAIK